MPTTSNILDKQSSECLDQHCESLSSLRSHALRGGLCALGDILRAVSSFEESFRNKYGICLNEGMLLCRLTEGAMSSSSIAEALGLSCSNASKVIKSAENKGLVLRKLGQDDKRMMFFELSRQGIALLSDINGGGLNLDPFLDVIRCDCDKCRGRS